MQVALLGPCFKTGPSPGPYIQGAIGGPRGFLPQVTGYASPVRWEYASQVSEHVPLGLPSPAPWGSLGPRTEGLPHEADTLSGLMPTKPPRLAAGLLGSFPGTSAQAGAAGVRGPQLNLPSSALVWAPGLYFKLATGIWGRLHCGRLDDLLACLPACFAQFPHGTYVLSGYQVEI